MIRANFGLVATVAGTALFGFAPKTSADIWEHQTQNNTSLLTSERITGDDIEGINVNIGGGDALYSFTARAESRFISIISGPSDQPGIMYVLDKDGKPFPVGSGFNDLTLEGVVMVVDVGQENVGQEVTFVFGNYGMLLQNDATVLYNTEDCGQVDPNYVETWNATGGQNLCGEETRLYMIDGIRGVPRVKTVNPAGAARALAAQRCCD